MSSFLSWVPDGELFSQSAVLSGEGFYPLSSLDATGLDAPSDGLILWRFDLILSVTDFTSSIIWNSRSAFSDQFRGGRFLVWGRGGLGEEYFVGRATQRVRRLWYYDADFGEDSTGTIGSGKKRLSISNETVDASYCERIYYGFEPTVQGRIRIEGTYMIFTNPGNEVSFELNRV